MNQIDDVIDEAESRRQTFASLISGILIDLRRLLEQQFQLKRRELQAEIRRLVVTALIFAAGGASLFLGGIMLCLSAAHLLHWMESPPGTDPAGLPLWACHAVVAAVLAIVGGILVYVGRIRLRAFRPFQNRATENLQENLP